MRKFLIKLNVVFLGYILLNSVPAVLAEEIKAGGIPDICAPIAQELSDALSQVIADNKRLTEVSNANLQQIQFLSEELAKARKVAARRQRAQQRRK